MDLRISSKMFDLENAGKLQSPPIEQASIVIRLYFVVLVSFIMTAIRNSAGYPNYAVYSTYKKCCDNLTNMYFSARWLARVDVHNGDILVPAEVESGFGIVK